MKRHVLHSLVLLLLAIPAHSAGSTQKPQRQTWYERVLNNINPDNTDFGAAWEQRKRAFIVQLSNPYFQYSVGATGALVLLMTVAVAQYTSHRRALVVAAQSLADVLRHDQHSREVAREAIRRYNEHIESCNQAIETSGATVSTPDPDTMSELNRLNAALLATRNENKSLRGDLETKSRMIADLTAQMKNANPPGGQIALDFVLPDYIARINELERDLAAEKEKNKRQKGTPVDAHRA
jgi:hypothetical protein